MSQTEQTQNVSISLIHQFTVYISLSQVYGRQRSRVGVCQVEALLQRLAQRVLPIYCCSTDVSGERRNRTNPKSTSKASVYAGRHPKSEAWATFKYLQIPSNSTAAQGASASSYGGPTPILGNFKYLTFR